MAPSEMPQPFFKTIVSLGTTICFLWVLLYIILAGREPGRSFYAATANAVFGDPKGGAPLLHLALPILVAGSLVCFGWTLPSLRQQQQQQQQQPPRPLSCVSRFCGLRLYYLHRWRHRLQFVQGDWNLNIWAMVLILFPSLVFLSMTMARHLQGKELSLDDRIMETSNSFGMTSEIMGSLLLIPVARYSSILQWMGWSPVRAVRWHIWIGRIFIIAAVVHGVMHMFRWQVLANERLAGMLFPPRQCWTWDNEQYTTFQPICVDENTDCSCYHIFRNMTGFLSVAAMLILLLTSLHPVRRHCYRLFYMSHIIAAPLALIMVVLHWNRSILYMAPSLLYYAASSLSTIVEGRMQCRAKNPGVRVVSMERIPSSSSGIVTCKNDCIKDDDGCFSRAHQAHYMSLTVEATEVAMQRFRPGYYVQLLAPEVSSISHPFTISTVPGEENQLRIIFKVIGQFTSQLSHRIQAGMPNSESDLEARPSCGSNFYVKPPQLYMNGYMGTPNRVGEVLCHDVAVMIAGGIGITPYLSLLHHVHEILCNSPWNKFPTKRIVLVWMCRDASLVDYVQREYFNTLIKAQEQTGTAADGQVDCKVKIIIYHTGDSMPLEPSYIAEQNESVSVETECTLSLDAVKGSHKGDNNEEAAPFGVPFAPSQVATSLSSNRKANRLGFLAYLVTSWVGLGLTWWMYKNVQTDKEVASRFWGILAIAGLGTMVAFLVNALAKMPCFRQQEIDEPQVSKFDLLPSMVEDEVDGLVRDVEMETLHCVAFEDDPEDADNMADFASKNESACIVSVEEKRGRPSIHQMLQFVDSGKQPGLFTCGPLGLMQDIREHTEERCMMRLQQCMRGASNHIAVYEEAFSM